MPTRHQSRAFILDAADYRETSKLLHVLCENEGRISLIAKGLRGPRSKKVTAAEPFKLVQITYTLKEGATLGLLTGIEVERAFSGVRVTLESYALAHYWLEIVGTAAQARLASPELFGLTESFLESLADPLGGLAGGGDGGAEVKAGAAGRLGPAITDEVAWHFGRLLQALGFGAQLDACANCGRTDLLEQFDPGLGAAVCARCAEPRRRYLPLAGVGGVQTADRVRLAELFASERPEFPSPVPGRVLFGFLTLLNELMTLHLDQPMRSWKFVRELFG